MTNSRPTRFDPLGDHFADLVAKQATFPIWVTIQPNIGWSEGSTGSEYVRKLARGLFYQLDRLYTGCPRPERLSHDERFNGFAIVEKPNASPHIHLLLSCPNGRDRIFRSTFLLECLDNVTKARDDARDDRWQRATRDAIKRHPWSSKRSWAPSGSVLTQFAARGTGMVQIPGTKEDVRRVAGYYTKSWGYSATQLASRRNTPLHDWALDWFELRDFFPPDPSPVARPWSRGQNGSRILDLDNLAWRVPGRGVVK